MNADDAKVLRRLKNENGRLMPAVADVALDNQMLKEVALAKRLSRPGDAAQIDVLVEESMFPLSARLAGSDQ